MSDRPLLDQCRLAYLEAIKADDRATVRRWRSLAEGCPRIARVLAEADRAEGRKSRGEAA